MNQTSSHLRPVYRRLHVRPFAVPALLVLAFAVSPLSIGPAHAQMPAALVVVSPTVEREISAAQISVGSVMPLRLATIGSAVDGRVVEFPLEEGDRVESGQAMAQLLTDTITLELEAAEAELEYHRQLLAELENGTRPEEIEQAKSLMISAEARARYANARRTRAEQLYNSSRAISEEEVDQVVALAVEAEQSYIQAQQSHKLAVEGPRKEKIAQARAQVAMQQATVNRLRDQITKHTVIARFAGYITAEHTEVGQWVKQGDPVVEVAAMDEVEVIAQVVEQYVRFVRPGQQVTVDVPALPGRAFAGIVSAIVPQADLQARTFPVKVRVTNEILNDEPVLKSGMYARVLLPTGDKQMATLVPKDALVLGGPQPVVFIVQRTSPDEPAGSARPVPVQIGVAEGEWIQVTGPLMAGDLVVVQGNERLKPMPQDVQIQRVAPAPAPAPSGPLTQADRP